jgi:AraC family transcriptional regulator of arabinose operon
LLKIWIFLLHMTVRPITPHIATDPATPLVCGEFRQGLSYANWRPAGSGDWLLLYTVAGAGRIVTDGREFKLGEKQAALFRPDAPQDYATDPAADHWLLRWAHFTPKPHWEPWLLWPEIGRGVGCVNLGTESAERFAGALNRTLIASRLGGVYAADLALNALEEALIWAHRDLAGDRWLRLDPRIRKAVAHLAADPGRLFSISELAKQCGLSVSRFGHLFKDQVRMTPRRFSEKLRLELAAQLLAHTSMPVAEVAYKAGFEDPLYFSRRFVRTFGRTPMASRSVARQSRANPNDR